jgi:FAD/FMN-containing dehydrogenase
MFGLTRSHAGHTITAVPIFENRKARVKEQKIARWTRSSADALAALKLSHQAVAALERRLQGTLAVPGDPAYEQDEQNWNPAYHERPALIAFCEVAGDVRECLAFAGRHGLQVVCRSGGHSTAGYCLATGALVVDVSRINDVVVDPGARRVTVGGGTSFHKLNAVLDEYGLHVPGGGCPDVCVGGYMQGGGYGFTSRMFGIHCDNVLQVRVMLADGRIVVASSVQNPDLFWAVRGGTGNNFGVLLEVVYQLYDLPAVWAFGVRWPAEGAARALNYLQHHYMKTNGSRRLGYQGVLAFQNGQPTLLARGMVRGDTSTARDEIAGMLGEGGGTLDLEGTGSYLHWNIALLDNIPEIQPSRDGYALKEAKFSTYIGRILEAAEWQQVVDYFATAPQPSATVGMEIYGGAINHYPAMGNAFVHRDVHMDFFVDSFWYEPGGDAPAHRWLNGFRQVMERFWNGHVYQNYPRRDDPDYRWQYWGEAFNSLLFVKQKYDPANFFTFPQAISPLPADDTPGIHRPTAPSFFSDPVIVYA